MAEGIHAGHLPRHHACGIDLLKSKGCSVKLIDPCMAMSQGLKHSLRLNSVGELCDPLQLGRATTRALLHDATLYSFSELSLGTPPVVRRLGRHRPRIVTIVHGEYQPSYLVGSVDGAICLNDGTAEQLDALGLKNVIRVMWGPDLDFPGYHCAPPERFSVVSIGNAGRDMQSLLRALAAVGDVPAVVNARTSFLPINTQTLDDVSAHGNGLSNFDPATYSRPMEAFRYASIFVIPLIRQFDTPVGLTEVNDALALGRPIVMTRTRYLGFDIEAEGLGIWVNPGDVDQLIKAIRTLRDDESMRREMGAKARSFAERRWNYARFSTDIDRFMASPGL
jgi:glycosyltransferase involved in cell wall biosynthesis